MCTIAHALSLLVSISATDTVLEGPVLQLEKDARAWCFHQQLQGWTLLHSWQDNELFTMSFHDCSVTRMGHLSGCNSTSFLLPHFPTDGQEWGLALGRHSSLVARGCEPCTSGCWVGVLLFELNCFEWIKSKSALTAVIYLHFTIIEFRCSIHLLIY